MASVYSNLVACETHAMEYLDTSEANWRFGNLSEEQQNIISGFDDTRCGQMCLVRNMLLPGSALGELSRDCMTSYRCEGYG